MQSFSLKDYSQVIVDGSNFINRFPDTLAKELTGSQYYTSASFNAECKSYLMHMTQEQRQVFTDNFQVLKQGKAQILERSDDLWSGLDYVSRSGRSILLITSNLLLIEKIVLRDLRLDIYNLHQMQFMPRSGFAGFRKLYTCEQDREIPREKRVRLFNPDDGSVDVYDETRWIRNLQRETVLKDGLEAYLYEDPADPQLVAKLFTPARRTDAKLSHVKNLVTLNRERMHCDWAALPEQMLYLKQGGKPLGFLMRRFKGYRSLEVAVKRERTEEKKVATILDWCLMLATQAAYLGVFGIYITDYSDYNFLIPDDDAEDRHIVMLDTDSFCRDSYFGGRFDNEIKNWSILDVLRDRAADKADLIDMSTRLLFAEIFYIVTAGYRPYDKPDHYVHDVIDCSMEEDGFFRYVFPGELLDLMDRVLRDVRKPEKVPSADGMIDILFRTVQTLADQEPDLTYQTLLQRHRDGICWEINGLEKNPEPEPDPIQEPEPVRDPVPTPAPRDNARAGSEGNRASGNRRTSFAVRKPDKHDPFSAPRLMGAVVHPETTDVIRKVPQVRVSRMEANDWKYRQQVDQKKADRMKKLLYWGLFLSVLMFAVWLCLFAEFDLIRQIRQAVIDWADRTAFWWTEEVLPLLKGLADDVRDFIDRIISLLPKPKGNA